MFSSLSLWIYEVVAFLAGILGVDYLAANIALLNLVVMVFIIPSGIALSTGSYVGVAVGECNYKKGLSVSQGALVLASSLLTIVIVSLFFLRTQVGYLFSADESLSALITDTLPYVLPLILFDGV